MSASLLWLHDFAHDPHVLAAIRSEIFVQLAVLGHRSTCQVPSWHSPFTEAPVSNTQKSEHRSALVGPVYPSENSRTSLPLRRGAPQLPPLCPQRCLS